MSEKTYKTIVEILQNKFIKPISVYDIERESFYISIIDLCKVNTIELNTICDNNKFSWYLDKQEDNNTIIKVFNVGKNE